MNLIKNSELLFIGERAFYQSFIKKNYNTEKCSFDKKRMFFMLFKHSKSWIWRNIDDNAFSNCLFEKFFILSNVVRIGDSAFSYCNNLEKVEFEKNSKLRIIEKLAFTQMEEILLIVVKSLNV